MNNSDIAIFLGGPFSAAMKSTQEGITFDSRLRIAIERTIGSIQKLGCKVLSSHIADRFGAEFDEKLIVKRDNQWVESCDLYIALLPFDDGGEPYRTDGTFIELGIALASKKRVLIAIEQPRHAAWSYYVRNLEGASEKLTIIEWNQFMEGMLAILEEQTEALRGDSESTGSAQNRLQTTDAVEVLRDLAAQKTVERVDFRGMNLGVFPGVFSPKVSHAPDYIVENWTIPKGCHVLDLGCGSGVLGLYALYSGAGSLVSIDNNPIAVQNTKFNAEQLGFGNRSRVLEGSGYDPLDEADKFDVIVLSPPYWNKLAKSPLEAACFDEEHKFLATSVLGASKHLTEHGTVFIVFSDQGDVSKLTRLIQQSGLSTQRMLVQRPTMPGGHIRFFYELTRF